MSDQFVKLPLFQESHSLVLQIYKITKKFPEEERYGLTSQLRRSASSIPANVIEGNSRGHKKEFLQFLYVALASLEETKYHLLLAKDLGYFSEQEYSIVHEQSEVIGKQLRGLIKYCKSKAV